MAYWGVPRKRTEILRSRDWNAVVAALDDIYEWLTSGTRGVYFGELVANTAVFNRRPTAEGRPVLLDWDPITLYDIEVYARDRLVEAIDLARVTGLADWIRLYTGESRGLLELLYARTLSREDVREAIETSITTTYIREVRDRVVAITVDQYGNIGVRIAEPLDEYGRVRVAPPLDEIRMVLREELAPLYASDYNILTIDLGVARTDELVADNVVTLWIVSYTSGATFSIKLFDTTKPGLTQADLPPGTVIERLRLARVYLSNPAQAGYTLRLAVLRVV
jgi:hypothetical protein